MPDSEFAKLLPGRLLLVAIESQAEFISRENPHAVEQASSEGEIRFLVMDSSPGRVELRLLSLGLYSDGPESWGQQVGRLSFSGATGSGVILLERDGLSLNATMEVRGLYAALWRKRGFPEKIEEDFRVSSQEEFSGSLTCQLQTEGEGEWSVNTGNLQLTHFQGGLARVQQMVASLGGNAVSLLPDGQAFDACPAERAVSARFLRVRPIGIKRNAGDSPTGGSWPNQRDNARMIWGGCCISFDEQPMAIMVSQLKSSPDTEGVVLSPELPAGKAGVIDVIFVDNPLVDVGGGNTFGGGSDQAMVVLTDSDQNPNLLAHELGHVLNMVHPQTNKAGFFTADPRTVLETGNPNPPRNTVHNCLNAENTGLKTNKTPHCISA